MSERSAGLQVVGRVGCNRRVTDLVKQNEWIKFNHHLIHVREHDYIVQIMLLRLIISELRSCKTSHHIGQCGVLLRCTL